MRRKNKAGLECKRPTIALQDMGLKGDDICRKERKKEGKNSRTQIRLWWFQEGG